MNDCTNNFDVWLRSLKLETDLEVLTVYNTHV